MPGTIAATVIMKARKKIAWHFLSAGATSAATATAFERPETRLGGEEFDRMVAFGALEKTDDGRYWLHRRRYADYRKESLARVLGYLALAGFAAAGAMALG